MRGGTQAVVALLVFVTADAAASCRQVAGIGDPQRPPECSRAASMSATCNACVTEHCCAEVEACDANPLCRSLVDCLARCSNDACSDACEELAKPNDAAAALLACRASSCDTACTGGCGGAGRPFVDCKPCAAPCCADGKAFRGSTAGRTLRACRFACSKGDQACKEECTNVHASGADLERAARECAVRACNVTADWSCVGGIEARRVTQRTKVTFGVGVVDSRTLAPLAGVTVKGCSVDDLTCREPPFGMSTTAADGRAEVDITLRPSSGQDAYSGFIELSHPAYVPSLVYLFPGTVASAGMPVPMTATSFLPQIIARAGVPLAADRGGVALLSNDCAGFPRRGTSVRMVTPDAETRTFYLGSASAGEDAYDFSAVATGEAGIGGIFNVRAGTHRLALSVDDLCLSLGTIDVAVRAGAITYAVVNPLPR